MTSIRPMMMNRRMRHGSAATTRIWMPIFICVLVSQWCVLVTKQLGSPHYVGIYVSAADVIDERKEEYPQIRSSSSSSTASRSSSSSSSTTPGSSSSSSSGSNKATADAGSSTSTFRQILAKAARRGMGGGISGAIAGIVQVLTLMWIRTIISYQTRYGTGFQEALSVLYKEGGIARLYRGLGFALIQAPLARFGSTAANDGVEALIAGLDLTDSWGSGRSTVIASIVVGLWRILLMPIDTCKTVLQVDNKEGFRNLMKRVREGKFFVLYQGAAAIAMSSIMGHYPWYVRDLSFERKVLFPCDVLIYSFHFLQNFDYSQ